MDTVLVALAAVLASGLTFFSGFGLGTLLLPAFVLFMPADAAVAAAALVHLANNLFKLALVGRRADLGVVVRFGIPAALLAFAGAGLLGRMSRAEALATWSLGSRTCTVTILSAGVGLAMAAFAFLELSAAFDDMRLGVRWLPVGGALSGLFGGLTGHQGALRTAFLARAGLARDSFIATGAVCAVVVDLSRLAAYGFLFLQAKLASVASGGGGWKVMAACAGVFAGSMLGRRLSRRFTLHAVHRLVGVLLILMAIAVGAGVV